MTSHLGFNFTASRIQLMDEMLIYGPRSYDGAHSSWIHELHVMRRHRLVSFRGGLWRATKAGRKLLEQRIGLPARIGLLEGEVGKLRKMWFSDCW